ncbi:MAG: hypothetical protein K0S49_34 [Microbacterium sp.]|nr:hypothetical protein [Microbacterium sp.]
MSLPTFAMTYVAYWRDAGVLKVGRAWRWSRVQEMTISGARIIILARNTDATWEREALRRLRRWFPAAFNDEREASQLLFRGRGWSECFRVDEYHLQLAVDLCIEGFARGNDQGFNEVAAEDDQRNRSRVRRLRPRPLRSEGDSTRALVPDGPRRPPATRRPSDRRRALPVGQPPGSDRPRRAPHPHARGVRLPDHLRGAGLRMDTAPQAPQRRQTRPRVHFTPTTPNPARNCPSRALSAALAAFHGIPGYGEGACVGAREGEGEGEGPGAGGGGERRRVVGSVATVAEHQHAAPAGTSAAAESSAHRLLGSPQRSAAELWSLRYCPPATRSLALAGTVRGAARDLRRGAGGGRR